MKLLPSYPNYSACLSASWRERTLKCCTLGIDDAIQALSFRVSSLKHQCDYDRTDAPSCWLISLLHLSLSSRHCGMAEHRLSFWCIAFFVCWGLFEFFLLWKLHYPCWLWVIKVLYFLTFFRDLYLVPEAALQTWQQEGEEMFWMVLPPNNPTWWQNAHLGTRHTVCPGIVERAQIIQGEKLLRTGTELRMSQPGSQSSAFNKAFIRSHKTTGHFAGLL